MANSKCIFCKKGSYRDIPVTSNADLHNSGLGLKHIGMTGWKAVECDECGNVQVFRRRRSEDEMR